MSLMCNQDVLSYYCQQSSYTDAGAYMCYLNELPNSIPELCAIIHGILIHDADGAFFNYKIDKGRAKKEVNLKFAAKIFARIFEMNSTNLQIARSPETRVISSCREFALLLCTFLRHKKIPSRLRYGFASYTYPNSNFNPDHVIVEYWDKTKQQWIRVDARTSTLHIEKKRHLIEFDIYDVPHTEFMSAGWVWQQCRSNSLDPNHFGYGLINRVKGLWYIRDKMVQDIASLNLHEMMLWDIWGLMFLDESFDDDKTGTSLLPLLDHLALISTKVDRQFLELNAAFKNISGLQIPKKYLSLRRDSDSVAEFYKAQVLTGWKN